MRELAVVCTTAGHLDYARPAVESFLVHSPTNAVLYLLDDCSPNWYQENWDRWPPHVMVRDQISPDEIATRSLQHLDFGSKGKERVLCYRFPARGGWVRSLELGARLARSNGHWGADYTVLANDDVLFSPNWWPPLREALQRFHLVGPVTNAPGEYRHQQVAGPIPTYNLSDAEEAIRDVSQRLKDVASGKVISVKEISGFFMAARTDRLWSGAHGPSRIFSPRASAAQAAYELQHRWRRASRRIGVVVDSFILHYRAVSRGRSGLRKGNRTGMLRKK